MEKVSFVVYSDIHHDLLSSKCVSMDDSEQIEMHIQQQCREHDFSIFGGDRFFLHEPKDEVKTRADRILLQDRRTPQFQLVGNHDWTDYSLKWHTSESIKGYPNLFILDRPGTYRYQTANGTSVLVHALPSRYKFDPAFYVTDPKSLNIFLFHDIVHGSYLDDDGRAIASSKMSLSEIDRPEFDLVLAGDIHVPQRLSLMNTVGGYIGAALQRTRSDAGKSRGWMIVEASRKRNEKWNFSFSFKETKKFFSKMSFDCNSSTVYENITGVINEDAVKGTLLEITLRGTKEDVDRIISDKRWSNLETFNIVKHLEFVAEYTVEKSIAAIDMSSSSGVLDDLVLYLKSGFVDIGGMSGEKITEIVSKLRGQQ